MPVRNEIEILAKRIYKSPKKSKKINILILGGSLGAQILSRNMCSQMCMLPENIKKRLHINHQAKEEDIIYISKRSVATITTVTTITTLTIKILLTIGCVQVLLVVYEHLCSIELFLY